MAKHYKQTYLYDELKSKNLSCARSAYQRTSQKLIREKSHTLVVGEIWRVARAWQGQYRIYLLEHMKLQ